MHPAAATIGALASGTRFGSYEIVRQIGGGGMGTVYEAVHTGLGKRVALKTLHAGLTTDPECVGRFLREGRASARLRHPNVVDVTDVGVHERVPYLVMELLEGESLADILDREGRISPTRTLDLLLPVASTLAAAHAEGVLHRDLKPDNIFVSRTSVGPAIPKLLDFGISKVVGESSAVTGSGEVLGTPYYMSPEQTRGVRHVTRQSDQYSLAVVVYECLTGARPFEGGGVLQVLAAIIAKPIPPLRSHVPSIPAGLEAIVLKGLAREPDARFESVNAFAAALLEFADDTTRRQWEPVFVGGALPVARSDEPSAQTDLARTAHLDATTTSPQELDGDTTPDRSRTRARRRRLMLGGLLAGLVATGFAAFLGWRLTIGSDDHAIPSERPTPSSTPSTPPTRVPTSAPAEPVTPAAPAAPEARAQQQTPPAAAPPEALVPSQAEPAPPDVRGKQRRIPRPPIVRREAPATSGPRIGRNGAPIVR